MINAVNFTAAFDSRSATFKQFKISCMEEITCFMYYSMSKYIHCILYWVEEGVGLRHPSSFIGIHSKLRRYFGAGPDLAVWGPWAPSGEVQNMIRDLRQIMK